MGRKRNELIPASNTPEYYLAYYHAHNEFIPCQGCGLMVRRYSHYQHRKTKSHVLKTEINRLNNELMIANSQNFDPERDIDRTENV